jgi:archaemetzincin
MKKLQILPVGPTDPRLLDWLRQQLQEKFQVNGEILSPALDVSFALHSERQQYHSSEILAAMQPYKGRDTWKLLAVTSFDLYIPILTFVFGEAQVGGTAALVSYHRLRQEFYGLPENLDLLADRLLIEAVHELGHTLRLAKHEGQDRYIEIEAVHELGHTLRLTHCDDYRCAMAPSHAVEWIDLKDSGYCESCLSRVLEAAR